jgi:hypothetical protein
VVGVAGTAVALGRGWVVGVAGVTVGGTAVAGDVTGVVKSGWTFSSSSARVTAADDGMMIDRTSMAASMRRRRFRDGMSIYMGTVAECYRSAYARARRFMTL